MRLTEAMRVVAAADPAEKLRQEMHAAVADVDFKKEAQRIPPGPSMAGQSPANAALIAQRQRVHEEGLQAQAEARARRVAALEQELRLLQAGQAPSNVELVKASINQGG